MQKKSKKNIQDIPDYVRLIPEYSDEEILNILKKRKHYQPEAAELAIKEAIKRDLIHSEQDLFSKEFQVNPLQKSLFPEIENEKSRKKIVKSIARGLLISGLIPTIFGFLKLNEGNFIEGGILILGGLLWIILATQLIREVSKTVINSFYFLFFIAAIFSVKLLLLKSDLVFMDVFILVVIFSLLFYGLTYIHRLSFK